MYNLIHLQCGRSGLDPWVGKIPWRWAWQPTPVFLPGASPWTEKPGGLQSMGWQRVGHDGATKYIALSLIIYEIFDYVLDFTFFNKNELNKNVLNNI